MDKQKQIINFLKYLSLHGVSPKSLKYYKSDFISFLNWAGNKKINQSLILEYINSIRAVTPISTLKRRQSTLRSYASFMGFKKVSNTWQESILSAFTKKPRLQNFFHKLFFSRPNWYRTYHSYQLATYIHVAILVLFTSIAGFAVYDQIFNTKNNLLAFPTALTRPNRFLSFQGRLTSNVGNPITTATNLVFKLYTASTAGTELWSSGTCSITPDSDGIFSTLLGSSCGAEIAATVFSENASVWVGVTVAADAEATPRVQIATVAYALNSETLQGYPAGTGTSTIPYIASTGTLVLANASPKIQSTSGTFAVEGLAMTITTPNASNGVITVNPDGVGTLDLTFEGTAAGLSANGFVNATNANITSGALYGGTVASAATGYNFIDFQSGVSPASVFSVQNDGDIITAGDLNVNGDNITADGTLVVDGAGLTLQTTGAGTDITINAVDQIILTDFTTCTALETVANVLTCGTDDGGSTLKWNALTAPDGNLSLAHAGYTTAFTFNSVTTADAFALSSSSLTTGTILDLSSTSTAGGASGSSKILDITRSGTNSNASHTAYGLYSAVTNTGTTSTNVGGYFSASGATNNYGLIVGSGNVGIGTTGPDAKLDSLSTTEQLRLTYTDGSVYSSFTTDSSGNLTIDNTGSKTVISDNLQVTGGSILNSVGTANIIFSAAPTTTANTLSASNWLIENTANVGQAALMVNQTKAGDLFTASASGTPKFTLANTGAITSAIGNWTSQVADSSTAVGFTFNTSNTLSTQGAKLLSFQNLGTEKMYLDKDGNLYVAGTLLSGNGTSMLLTNKSGGIVASKAIVVLDTTNNTSFTTTTTPYSKSGFGVVVGVGLGVTNDADGDGACDANDICMVAYGGSVNVTVKNATTAVKGDYLFTSDTAGSAVASAKQYDGLIGIVDDTTNAASGYLKMIFKVQPQVTAAAAIDKTTKHNEYWLYADQYAKVGEGSNTDTNLLNRGLAFDTFSDSTKTDSANTTASFDTNTQKTGLIGGQTLATSTTDNDGQTYLGSNTVNDTYYYDRAKDSDPQVQVELGIDPNWYNGVTLSVATTSAQFSQNSVITQKNPNLSTSYNGSLVKVTGTDSTPSTIYITIKSPTTFDWTNYQGDSATGVTMTFGTAQALGTTGVSATFTNARYNTGDVFKIASWFIEAESATRGAKQQFPERSTIIATASSVDIIDADTQKLWMRFSQGTAYAIGVDANNDPSSANMLNGKAYISTNGSAATGLYTLDFVHDAAFKQNATDYRLSDTALYGRNGTNTYNVINTSNILVNITANDVSAAVIPNQPTQTVTVSGWGYIVGDNTKGVAETVNFPYKFNETPNIVVSQAGVIGSVPTKLSSCSSGSGDVLNAYYRTATTSNFAIIVAATDASAVVNSSTYYCYSWTATGQVSPRQYVAVATGATGADGGTSIINETDGTAINLSVGANHANIIRQNKIAIANNALYASGNDESANLNYISVYYNLAGLPTDTSLYSLRSVRYDVSAGVQTRPEIKGSATGVDQITSLSVTPGTSTVDGSSNTLYVGSTSGVSVIQEYQSHANADITNGSDNNSEQYGSVKYYTKDYISEEMVGDIRGMWPLNASNTSADLEDVSVKANVLTATNITSADAVSGVRNEATDFDGSTEYLSRADDADLDFGTSTFTLGAWVKTTDTDGAIMRKSDTSAGTPGYLFDVVSNKARLFVRNSSGTNESATSNKSVNDGLWHHIIAVRDADYLYIYIDGQLDNRATSSDLNVDNTGSIGIGADVSAAATFYLSGSIDEPFVTAAALTASQVKNMYQVGYRALQSHATTLGGGAADTNQQLGFISTGTNVVGDAKPDWNNQFMYVGTNSTTLGAVSKIDLNSDTNIKTYNSSANVPTGGALLIDEDTKSLAVGYNLEAVGSAASGVKTMGVDNNATATSGNFIGKTITTAESFTQAYLWAQYTLDASDASNTIQVWASNDGGSNYYQCNVTNTDTSRSPSEYEYFCQFNTAGSSLKTKFIMARGSTKTNTWVSKYGIAWIDSNAVAGSANGSGLFTGTNASVANGSYIDVAHNQNSNDVVTNGWVYNTATSKWEIVGDSGDATGGTVTYKDGYTIHTFTSSGTFTPVNAGNVEYLVVGGGGGSGSNGGGGGGAGGFRTATGFAVTAQGYTVTVGEGGAGNSGTGSGASGSDSVFSTITSTGGGGGGNGGTGLNGLNGGSGGGAHRVNTAGLGNTPSTSPSQGNNGGIGLSTGGSNAGGGGGAGAVGSNATGTDTGGIGGAGTASSISGSSVVYAGGGGGGGTTAGGAGGSGGGGAGGASGVAGSSGTANTGGGGGGGGNFGATTSGGNGGSGIVIIRYLTNSLSGFKITQQDANTVRLYNYSGATQNLRLDVITGGLGRNAGTVSLAPAAADVDSAASTNSIWINKTGSAGNLLKLQTSGTDVLSLTGAGLMTLTGNFVPGTDDTYDLGTTTARWKDIYLGPATAHIGTSTTDEGTISYDTSGNIFNFGTDATTNGDIAFFTDDLYLDKSTGNVGIGTTSPQAHLQIGTLSDGTGEATNHGELLFSKSNASLATTGGIEWKIASDNYGAKIDTISAGGANLVFGLRNNSATWSEKMRIDPSGNVGIGTTGPAEKLDISGNVRIAGSGTPTLLFRNSGYPSIWGGSISMTDYGDGMGLNFNTSSGADAWGTRMVVRHNGNVGIGTTAPGRKFVVASPAAMKLSTAQGALFSDVANDGGVIIGSDFNIGSIQGTNAAGTSAKNLMLQAEGGNVGIGMTSPTLGKLSVNGVIHGYGGNGGVGEINLDNGASTSRFQVRNETGGWALKSVDASDVQIFTDNILGRGLTIKQTTGNVGIGTTAPGYKLTVNSSTPGCNGCTAWTNYSDSRLKENIVNLSGDILDKIMDLKPVTFNYNDAYYSQTGYSRPDGTTPTFTGFVAQDLQQIFPEMVSTASSGYLDTNLSNLQIYLVKGIQQQQGQIASLSGQLAGLLQIDGSCVTGDTMLPIRRKKKRRNSDDEQDEYDDLLCRIDDILPGDEVLSLNEFTGALEYARINKLKDMDIKEVYELTTKSGKVIRTTANHPYLTISEDHPIINNEKINI